MFSVPMTAVVIFPVFAIPTVIMSIVVTAVFTAVIISAVMVPAIVVVMAIITATVYVGDAVPIHISLLNVARAEVVVITRLHKVHWA